MSEQQQNQQTETDEVSAAAEASSAHARVNIPLNLDCWKHLSKPVQDELLWFHQHLLDERLSWEDATEAIGYDRSTIFRCLKGTYSGSWPNVAQTIKTYRRIADQRGSIHAAEWVSNTISEIVAAGLDYALANNSIVTIVGESRVGKTVAAKMWRNANNHGTTVYVVAPPYGGAKMFLRRLADAVGVNKNSAIPQVVEAVSRSFNRNRMLIVDEAHRLLPTDRRSPPTSIEILRDIHDITGCALALLSTKRFDDELKKSDYMYEQILGRIGMPIRLPVKLEPRVILPIVRQYLPSPGETVLKCLMQIANDRGRLGILVEVLKIAARIARRSSKPVSDDHILKAIKLRTDMMGDSVL